MNNVQVYSVLENLVSIGNALESGNHLGQIREKPTE